MKKNLFLVGGLMLAALVGCQNDLEEINQPAELMTKSSEETSEERVTLNVAYKGQKFVTDCERVNDSTIVYLNEDFNTLFETTLRSKSNLTTVSYPDGSIEYFDSVSEAEAAIQYEKLNEQEAKALTRSDTGIIGRTQMWDNIDGMGDDIIIYAGMYQFAQVPNLGASPYYFNDKVTSLNVYYTGDDNTYCTVLHAYENTQYSGNVLICIGKQWDHHVHRNLSWYACGNGTWDNKISSLTLEIAKVGDYEMNH